MKVKVCLAVCLVLSSFTVLAQQKAPEMSPEEKAAMESMMKAATPGAEHKMLAESAGTWDATVKMWNAPGMEPTTSTGVATNTMVLGGRYLKEDFNGNFMGMPFTGMGFTAYDNVTKQYYGTWMDTFSTGMMTSTGTCAGANCTFTSSMPDPMSGKMVQGTTKVNFLSKDKHVMEMWGAGPDGKQFKMMEITYTRKKG
jgi:hypothetical protein